MKRVYLFAATLAAVFLWSVPDQAIARRHVTPVQPPPAVTASPEPTAVPAGPLPTPIPLPASAAPVLPLPLATPVPITFSTGSIVLPYGSNAVVQAYGIYGAFTATSSDEKIAEPVPSQDSRQIVVMARGLGSAVITVVDSRGTEATIPVGVELAAGRVASAAEVRITGAPASALFVGEEAANAAIAAAAPARGASVTASPTSVTAHELDVDGIAEIAVLVSMRGRGLYPIDGTTHVRVENFAQPHVHPTSLLVSDFPERLHEDGLLLRTQLQPEEPMRLLFYHLNPAGQPHRWIVLQATNHGAQDATVLIITGRGGPSGNEMFVGHLSTERFLVREAQNEGVFVTVPAGSTIALTSRSVPPGNVVSDVLQLREVSGAPLDLALTAQQLPNANAEVADGTALLTDTVSHARGRYPIPEFFYEATYDTSAPQLEIPIGQLPLPNLREGVALAGDYGVLFSINATLINPSGTPAEIALYATPRGGRATGTFLIDRVLVQAHGLPPYSHYKLKQYTVPAHGFVNVGVVTMPEGGSSYPLNLIFAPDDGSVPPATAASPIY